MITGVYTGISVYIVRLFAPKKKNVYHTLDVFELLGGIYRNKIKN